MNVDERVALRTTLIAMLTVARYPKEDCRNKDLARKSNIEVFDRILRRIKKRSNTNERTFHVAFVASKSTLWQDIQTTWQRLGKEVKTQEMPNNGTFNSLIIVHSLNAIGNSNMELWEKKETLDSLHHVHRKAEASFPINTSVQYRKPRSILDNHYRLLTAKHTWQDTGGGYT